MLINYGKKFVKQYEKADLKIKNAFKSRLKIFKQELYNPILNNHSLTGQYEGYRSINVTGNWRAIYTESQDKNGSITVRFKLLGTHSELYG